MQASLATPPGSATGPGPRVGLFVTCLVDLFRPSVGFATVELLEQAGCRVVVPQGQTCCGQPALNSGDFGNARELARRTISAFEGCDYVVAPSGSCIRTLRHDYPDILAHDPRWAARAQALAERCHEITSFLVDVMGGVTLPAAIPACTVTYHDTCSGLRGLGVREQPRQLLAQLPQITLREMQNTEVCCGFGGTFCVKYPELSAKIGGDKAASAAATGADVLVGGDMGCLLHLSGRLRRDAVPIKVCHVTELLTGRIGAGLGQPQ
ncbi:(Fe-S)-binding protein [Bordetella genomosp. 13]|uniref:(Fe-S)-binding protein n=1 Tax=Bordetella genomosp. 13 TaxID=463040 RepID=UPI0011A66052|nr:(Fe-S)-binding protein [Bordetella genomosp. 13]